MHLIRLERSEGRRTNGWSEGRRADKMWVGLIVRQFLLALPILWTNTGATFMRIIRLKEVMNLTGLSRSTIYKYIADNVFPVSVPLGDRCVGWIESEVHDWILAKVAERDKALGLAS